MKIDAALLVHDLNQMPAVARFADDAGFDGIWTFETRMSHFCLSCSPPNTVPA